MIASDISEKRSPLQRRASVISILVVVVEADKTFDQINEIRTPDGLERDCGTQRAQARKAAEGLPVLRKETNREFQV